MYETERRTDHRLAAGGRIDEGRHVGPLVRFGHAARAVGAAAGCTTSANLRPPGGHRARWGQIISNGATTPEDTVTGLALLVRLLLWMWAEAHHEDEHGPRSLPSWVLWTRRWWR